MTDHTVDVIGIALFSNGFLYFDCLFVDLCIVNTMWAITLPCWDAMIRFKVTTRCWQSVSENWNFVTNFISGNTEMDGPRSKWTLFGSNVKSDRIHS